MYGRLADGFVDADVADFSLTSPFSTMGQTWCLNLGLAWSGTSTGLGLNRAKSEIVALATGLPQGAGPHDGYSSYRFLSCFFICSWNLFNLFNLSVGCLAHYSKTLQTNKMGSAVRRSMMMAQSIKWATVLFGKLGQRCKFKEALLCLAVPQLVRLCMTLFVTGKLVTVMCIAAMA